MSLCDEHLQQALQHAPDRDAAPNEEARDAVIAYASKAVAEKVSPKKTTPSFSLKTLWHSMSGWPLAGLGSAMAAVLVIVVFWGQRPQQTTFEATSSQVADVQNTNQPKSVEPQTTSAAQLTVLAAPAQSNQSVADTAEPKQAKIAVQDKVTSLSKQAELSAEIAPVTKPVEGAVIVAAAPPAVEMAPTAQPEAAAAKVASSAMPKAEDAEVLAERGDSLKKKDVARAAPVAQNAIAEARLRGAANAAKDIKAENLRVLTLNQAGAAVDEATGYRVEVIAGRPTTEALQAEMEAYNQAMRDWHAQHL